MVKHTVIWKIKQENKKENEQIIKKALNDLVGKISQIKSFEVGINENKGEYDVILISSFESYDDLKAYDVHPEHQKVKELIMSLAQKKISVDYEY